MPLDMDAIRDMARNSADKEGVMTDFDRLLVGDSAVQVRIPLRDTQMTAKHLAVLAEAVERARAHLSYKTADERASLLTVRSLLRTANKKINAYKRLRTD